MLTSSRFKILAFVCRLGWLTLVALHPIDAARVGEQMYVNVDTKDFSACFRLMNISSQVGCAAKPGGTVGVVFLIEKLTDMNWLIEKGPHKPYIVVMSKKFFAPKHVDTLIKSGKVNGYVVADVANISSDAGWSADSSSPNFAFSLYKQNDSGVSAVNWNTHGTGFKFRDWMDVPIIAITDKRVLDFLVEGCYRKFNRVKDGGTTYPLCGMQINATMQGARNTRTCMTRSVREFGIEGRMPFCSPVAGYNTLTTLNIQLPKYSKNLIVVSSRIDAFSLFEDLAGGADSPVTAVATLLATAKTLAAAQGNYLTHCSNCSDIMFVLFDVEALDYTGSTRFVYDLLNGHLQYKVKDGDGVRKFSIDDIQLFMEISQIGHFASLDDPVWIHTDPLSLKDRTVRESTTNILRLLKESSINCSIEFKNSSRSLQLPPASFQSFLKHRVLPGVVLADHETSFSNIFYHSQYDTPESIEAVYQIFYNKTKQAQRLHAISTVLARTLFSLATNLPISSPNVTAIESDLNIINELLYCYLANGSCDLFSNIYSGGAKAWRLFVKRNFQVRRYLPSASPGHGSAFQVISSQLLCYFTGVNATTATTSDKCKQLNKAMTKFRGLYYWIPEFRSDSLTWVKASNFCLQTLRLHTHAKSPAFLNNDYESAQYPTWTESVWDPLGVRMFLIPDPAQELKVLLIGIFIFLGSCVIVFVLQWKGTTIFNLPDGCPQ